MSTPKEPLSEATLTQQRPHAEYFTDVAGRVTSPALPGQRIAWRGRTGVVHTLDLEWDGQQLSVYSLCVLWDTGLLDSLGLDEAEGHLEVLP